MNERQELLRRTIVPCVVTTTIGVTATLFVKGSNVAAGLALTVLALLAGVYGLFVWVNPRLGFLPWLWVRQWPFVFGLVLLAADSVWLARVATSRGWLVSPGFDAVGLLWTAVVAVVLVGYGTNRLVPLIRPRAMPPEAGTAALVYMGKTQDRTGRGSTGPDGHPDAEFELRFRFGSSAERRSVVLVVLQRVSQTGRRVGQVWTSESLPSLWTLSVVDAATDVLLNPDGHLALGSVQNDTVFRLFAADRDDDDSDWFVRGQRYLATAYLSGNIRVTATTVLA